MASKQQRMNLRKSHPALWRSILVVSCMNIGLALNFWNFGFVPAPTFEPYSIPTQLVATIFFTIGVAQIFFLMVIRRLSMVRMVLSISTGWMMFWGISNTQQVFAGNASFQLPILYATISLLQVPLLIESPRNPFTEKR